jgi:hypothetical protein
LGFGASIYVGSHTSWHQNWRSKGADPRVRWYWSGKPPRKTDGIILSPGMWPFRFYVPPPMWTLTRDEVVTELRRDVQTAKFMFTVLWNPRDRQTSDRRQTEQQVLHSKYPYATQRKNIPRGKNSACRKIYCSHGQLFDPDEPSHRRLHKAK